MMFGLSSGSAWRRRRGHGRKRGQGGRGGLRLCHMRPCQRCVIDCMREVDPSQARYLASLGVMPNASVTVEQLAPFNGPVLLRVGDARYALGRDVAEQIVVREEQATA